MVMLWRLKGFAAFLTLLTTLGFSQTYDERRLIELARTAVASGVRGEPPAKLGKASPSKPVFVTIEVDGKVRGCRGDLAARTRSLEEEVVLAARAAATHDPRYRPISKEELKRFFVTVTIVERLEPLSEVSSLTPQDGLVLRAGARVGIVLPWEGKDTLRRLDWAYRKAGVSKDTTVSLSRLVAQRFRG